MLDGVLVNWSFDESLLHPSYTLGYARVRLHRRAGIMSCKRNKIAWQKASRPIPTNLLANPIEKIGNIATIYQHPPKSTTFFFEAGYIGIHRFLGVSSLTEA